MFPKKGNKFPGEESATAAYASTVADALQTELGQSHRATKTLTRWTGVSERTAKNWLSGTYGPSGVHLVLLARESDAVLAAFLCMAGRNAHMLGSNLEGIRSALVSATETVDRMLGEDIP